MARRRTDNTMTRRRRTDNTMARRRRTDKTMTKRRTNNKMARRRMTNNTMARRRTDNTMARRRRTNNAMARRKRTNNGLQNTTQKTKDWEKNSYYKLILSGMASNSCSTSDYCRVTVKRHEHHLIRKSCWTPVCENKYK
jgi:hypothetical protein